MAEYKNQVMLGIGLEDKNSVNAKLQDLIKNLNNTKIDLDINIKNSDVAKQLEVLTNLANNFKNSLGGNINLGNVNEIINQSVSSMERLNSEVLKTRTVLNQDGTGNRYSDIANGIGVVTKQTEVLNEATKKWELSEQGKTTTIVNNEKIRQTLDDIAKAQEKLNALESRGNINANQIDLLRNNLSGASENIQGKNDIYKSSEIQNYLAQVKQLEAEEKNNIQLANQIQDAWDKAYQQRVSSEQKSIEQIQANEKKAYDQEILRLGELAIAQQKAQQKENSDNTKLQNSEFINNQKNAYTQLNQLLTEEFSIKQKLITAEGEYKAKLEESLITNRQLQTSQNQNIKDNNLSNLQKEIELENQRVRLQEQFNLAQAKNNTSNTNSLTKDIQNTITQVEKLQQKFGVRLPNGFVESTISDLNKMIIELKEADNINFNGMRNNLNSVKSSIEQVTNETKQMINATKDTGTGGFFSSMSDFLGKTGLFYGTVQVVQELGQQIKNAYEFSLQLDKAFTDINITMNITKDQFSNMTNEVTQMGVEYGKSTVDIMNIAKTYANAQSSVEEVMSKVKPDLWLANVSRIDSADITKTLQSITNQFGLITKEGMDAEQATTKIGNSLVAVSKNMQFDFVDGIKRITEAVKLGGSIAENAKMSMDDFISMTGAFIQQSGMSGSEFANALKMISARVLQQKNLGEQLGISEDEMKMAEKTLNQYDISIRESGGNLRSLTDILKDTSVAFSQMNDSDRQYVAQKLAGVNQSARFIDIMKSMNNQQLLYNATQTDTNALYDAQQKYANGLEGKLGSLKATYEGMLRSVLTSDITKGMVVGLTELIKTFGNLPTVIGVATTALLVFKGQAILGAVSGIASFATSLITASTATSATAVATDLLTVSFKGLTTAIATNPLGFLAVAITTAIIAFDIFHKSMQETTNDIVEQSQKVKELNDSIEDLQTKSQRLNELSSKTDLNNNERQELVKLNNDLATQYPELISYYDSENKSFQINADSLQKLIDKKRENAMMENASNLGNAKEQIDKYKKQLEDAQNLLSTGKRQSKDQWGNVEFETDISDSDREKALKTIQEANDNISKLSTTVNQGTKYINDYFSEFKKEGKSVDEATEALKKLGYTDKDINDALTLNTKNINNNTDKINKDAKAKEDNANKTKVLAQANKELNSGSGLSTDTISKIAKIYPEVGDSADKAKEKVDAFNQATQKAHAKEIETATDAYEKSAESIAKAQGFLDKLNKAQAVTPQIASEVLKVYPELATQLGSVSSLQESLTAKIKEQQEAQNEAYLTMMQDDQNFYQQKIANNDDFKSAYQNFLNTFVTDGEQADNVDFNNYKTYAELKQGTQQNLGTAVQNWLISMVGESAKNYNIDFQNFKDFASLKAQILQQLANDITNTTNQMNSAIAEAQKWKQRIAEGNFDESTGATDYEASARSDSNEMMGDIYAKRKASLEATQNKIKTSFDDFNASIRSASVGDLGGQTDLSGTGGGSGGKGKSGKSDEEKAQKEAEEWKKKIDDLNSDTIKPDPYLEVNDTITQLDNSMKALKTSEDGLTGNDLANAKKKETDVMKQQIDAYKRLQSLQEIERDNLKSTLSQYGILTDETGNLVNAQDRLNQMQAEANAMTGSSEVEFEVKKKALQAVKDANEAVTKFGELNNKIIPETIDKWEQLANTIKKTNQETINSFREELAQDILKDAQEKVDSSKEQVEQAREDAKKALEDEKTAELKKWDEKIKSKQAELGMLDDETEDNEKKLKKINEELALWQKDNSTESTKKIQELTTQRDELEKTIKKNSIQKEIDSLGEQKQNVSDNYDEKLSDLESANKKQEKADEEKYKDMLNEKKAYQKADEMITKNQQSKMLKLLKKYDTSYKDIGLSWGQNVSDGFKEKINEIEKAVQELNEEIEKTLEKAKSSKKTKSGKSYKIDGNGNVLLGDVTPDEYEAEIGSYATGGRTPSNIGDSGALSILHKNEKILNANETEKFDSNMDKIDDIYNTLMSSNSVLFNQLSLSGNYIPPNIAPMTDLNRILSNITNNTNNDNSKTTNFEFNNTYNVETRTNFDATMFEKNISKQFKGELRKAGILKR